MVRNCSPLPRRSKRCIACSDLFYKSERAYAAAPSFQIEPTALGFDLGRPVGGVFHHYKNMEFNRHLQVKSCISVFRSRLKCSFFYDQTSMIYYWSVISWGFAMSEYMIEISQEKEKDTIWSKQLRIAAYCRVSTAYNEQQ